MTAGWIPGDPGMTAGWIPGDPGMTAGSILGDSGMTVGWIPGDPGMTMAVAARAAGANRHFLNASTIALPSGPAVFSHSSVIVAPIFSKSALSCGGGGETFIPFFLSSPT